MPWGFVYDKSAKRMGVRHACGEKGEDQGERAWSTSNHVLLDCHGLFKKGADRGKG